MQSESKNKLGLVNMTKWFSDMVFTLSKFEVMNLNYQGFYAEMNLIAVSFFFLKSYDQQFFLVSCCLFFYLLFEPYSLISRLRIWQFPNELILIKINGRKVDNNLDNHKVPFIKKKIKCRLFFAKVQLNEFHCLLNLGFRVQTWSKHE